MGVLKLGITQCKILYATVPCPSRLRQVFQAQTRGHLPPPRDAEPEATARPDQPVPPVSGKPGAVGAGSCLPSGSPSDGSDKARHRSVSDLEASSSAEVVTSAIPDAAAAAAVKRLYAELLRITTANKLGSQPGSPPHLEAEPTAGTVTLAREAAPADLQGEEQEKTSPGKKNKKKNQESDLSNRY